ncbi:hypothetical protein CKM354_000787300 [Cercospora kikuchii]|uniref:Uncharacterized protein n=1 Tax=Cercospora kikuchii TaxID=84275 RepID=A0A9P3CK46_9PEZI|nr:uncharacterized protein CKM354_000787300 [Cercospora kikuchii]GIZ44682.1 hypothetical protein CKM354_000787300 [Cercospora kikuchii]
MAAETAHPVILLLETQRQHESDLEARIRPLQKQIRDLRTDSYGNAGATLISRRDLAGGNYKYDKGLQAKQKVVYWQINRTFECIVKQNDDKIGKLYAEIDVLRVEIRRQKARVEDLEAEIKCDNIQAITNLAHPPALHCDGSVQRKPTGFLDLPAELRNEIYNLSGCLEIYNYNPQYWRCPNVRGRCGCRDIEPEWIASQRHHDMVIVLEFIDRGRHWIVDTKPAKGDPMEAVYHQPSLTRASKQIRNETLPMYYGGLRLTIQWYWTIGADRDVFHWLQRVSKHCLSFIKSVEVTIMDTWLYTDEVEKLQYIEGEKARCVKIFGDLGITAEQCEFSIDTSSR